MIGTIELIKISFKKNQNMEALVHFSALQEDRGLHKS